MIRPAILKFAVAANRRSVVSRPEAGFLLGVGCILAVLATSLSCTRAPGGAGESSSASLQAAAASVGAKSAHAAGSSDTGLPAVKPGDWPWWRGPALDGHAAAADPPLTWSTTQNIAWRTPLAGRGHASPILVGQRLYLANAHEDQETQTLECFDAATGKPLWTKIIHRGPYMHRHTKNSHASATPACDGRRIYMAFITGGALVVTAVDLDGNPLWQTEAAKFVSQHGYGSAPVLWDDMVIVSADNSGPCYLVALDATSGEIRWRTPRGNHASYATPIVANVAGRPQVLHSGVNFVASYDPTTGQQLWSCPGPTEVTASTMAFAGDLTFASGGFPGKEILAIRAGGSGDVGATHVAWRTKTGVSYVPSPIVNDGLLFVINDEGVGTCFAADTGKVHWRKRLGGNFTSSPIVAAGRIYVANEDGTTYVFKAAPKYELLAENKLDDPEYATPAFSGGRIYLRGSKNLYAIEDRSTASR